MAKGRDFRSLAVPMESGAALPPEATLELRADPSVGRIRLLSLPSSVAQTPTSAQFLPERTSVLYALREPCGQRVDVLTVEPLGEDEGQRHHAGRRVAAQPRDLGLLGAHAGGRGQRRVADGG